MKKTKKSEVKLPKNIKVKLPKKVSLKPTKDFINKNKTLTIGFLVVLIAYILGFLLKGTILSATVNGKPITRAAVRRELETQQGAAVLEGLINKELVLQEAKKQGVKIDDSEVNEELKAIEESLITQGQTLDEVLELQGMNRKQLIEQIRLQKLIEKILADKTTVTDEEVNKYIEENSESFTEDVNMDQVRELIKEQLKQQKLSEEFQTWFEKIVSESKVNYYTNY